MTNPNPLTPRITSETGVIMGRKGGKVKSERKKITCRLNGRMASSSPLYFFMRLAKTEDPNESYRYIIEELEKQKILAENSNDKNIQFYRRNKVMEKLIEIHKLKFGEKRININFNTAFIKLEEREKELMN